MTAKPVRHSRVKRGLSALLIFAAGTLFGAFAFYVVTMVRPEPARPVAEAPPAIARPAVTSPPSSPAVASPSLNPTVASPPITALPVAETAASAAPVIAPLAQAAVPPVPSSALPKGALLVPVLGVSASQLSDTFYETRGGNRPHEALDILAPRGTPVIAADDGKIVKLFKSIPGGLTIYQFDPSERFAYYYAHLDSYAAGVAEGKEVKRGEVIGYVGSTGNANPATPHLHFAIFELGPEKRWWKGTAINPYPLLTGR